LEDASGNRGGEVETNEGGNEGQNHEEVSQDFGFHHKSFLPFSTPTIRGGKERNNSER
jgi:hypothetical protein